MTKSIAQVFGANATLDTTTPSNPELRIKFSDIAAAAGFTTPPTSGATSGEKWFAAIFLNAKAYFDSLTDDSNNITIDDPFKTTSTRNSVAMIGYSHNATLYQTDANPAAPDPDNF